MSYHLTSPVRWGIIGCGDVTEVKSGPAFNRVSDSRLVAVMRRDAAKAADYARRHGVPRWYDDARALVADPEVDAIYIATPPGAHLDGALLAAAAGKPAYVEKPLARHTPECDRMIAAFAAAGVPLFAAYYRRALPRFVEVQRLLESNALGPPTSIDLTYSRPPRPAEALPWRVDAANSGGGDFLDLASHALDLCDWFFGPLHGVAGHAARLGGNLSPVEDTVGCTFHTATGVPGTGRWNFAAPLAEDRLQITGLHGRLEVSIFGGESITVHCNGKVDTFSTPTPAHVQEPLIRTVVDALLGRGECPSTGESARRTSVVMDQILAAYYGGREDAFWTRPNTWPGANFTL